MNRWVRAALITTLAFGAVFLVRHQQDAKTAPAGASITLPRSVRPDSPFPATDVQGKQPNAKAQAALSHFRVRSEATPEGAKIQGASYQAEVTAAGLRMESQGVRVDLLPKALEIGDRSSEITSGTPSLVSQNRAQVVRPGVIEEFVFENGRVEQLFRIDQPVQDEVRVRIGVAHNQEGGALVEHKASHRTWTDTALRADGIVIQDSAGRPRATYHSAKAIDAAGREFAFAPRLVGGEIVLAVPAEFMSKAAYPVLIDPWLELAFSATGGGVSISAKASESISMFLDDSGNPYVAWSDNNTGNFEIYLRYFNGEEWQGIAGSDTGAGVSDTPGDSSHPSVAFTNFNPNFTEDGFLAVAWDDNSSGDYSIYVKVFDGTTWKELAGSATADGISGGFGEDRHPQVAWIRAYEFNPLAGIDDHHAVPVVVYERARNEIQSRFFFPGDEDVTVAAWYAFNLSATASGTSERPSMALDPSGRPFVAWSDTVSGNSEIYVKGFFENAAGGLFNGQLYITVQDPAVVQIVTAGGGFAVPQGWVQVQGSATGPGISGTADPSLYPSIAMDSLNGSIYVAWQELAPTGPNVYFRRSLSPAAGSLPAAFGAWGGMLVGAGDNVSGTNSGRNPSMAVQNLAGTPIPMIAWQDDTAAMPAPQNPEIFVAQFTGGAWTSIGDAGSLAAARGVSQTDNFSYSPVLQVDQFGQPVVAWVDGALGSYDVYLRKFYVNQAIANSTDPGAAALTSPALTVLGQYLLSNPLTQVAVGGFTTEQGIRLRGILQRESAAAPAVSGSWLQIELRPLNAPFIGTQTLDSNPSLPGTIASTTGTQHEVIFFGLPNIHWTWRARAKDQFGRVSPWMSFGNNGDSTVDFEIRQPVTLQPPGTVQQFRSDATTVIGLGASSPENTVVLSGNLVPPNASLTVRLEVEVQPVGTALTGTATSSSGNVATAQTVFLTHPVLGNGSYHWAARTVASDNTSTAWTLFGANASGAADFVLSSPAPAAMDQRLLDDSASIPLGGVSPENGVLFTGTVASPSTGVTVALEVEVKPAAQAFNGVGTSVGSFVASGGISTVSVTGLPFDTYHWRARTVTSTNTTSAWSSFGTNADGQTDFQLFVAPPVVPVDDDKDKCGLLGLEVLLGLGLLALRRRRS